MRWSLKFSSDAPGAEWSSILDDADTKPGVYLQEPEASGLIEVKFTFEDGSVACFTARDTVLALARSLLSDTDVPDYTEKWDKATDLLRSLSIPVRTEVALEFELCPMHLCDEQICADDQVIECKELRK